MCVRPPCEHVHSVGLERGNRVDLCCVVERVEDLLFHLHFWFRLGLLDKRGDEPKGDDGFPAIALLCDSFNALESVQTNNGEFVVKLV
jgi:hypothetical protein